VDKTQVRFGVAVKAVVCPLRKENLRKENLRKENLSMPEKVLAVPASALWESIAYVQKGLIFEGADQLPALVARYGEFLDRPQAEADPAYKQIIPYAVIRHFDRYFLLQRTAAQSERRLHHKLSIGVGGHINPAEGPSETPGKGNAIGEGLKREIEEELYIASGYQERLVGLINDDTTEVGRVHLGILFEIDSVSSDVRVRETHKMEGAWALVDHLDQNYDGLESWSQIVLDSYLYPRALRRARDAKAG
jgi:predicted NUDIX family phosphoesterase